ncbi:50 kDa spicule matrix protein-like [Anguilla rostrata]|uniref:50 kDa spicule matrix protein-like n=1 Tax=Anguilla rostrata TaxID=7938 RepID=UPI0030D2AF73
MVLLRTLCKNLTGRHRTVSSTPSNTFGFNYKYTCEPGLIAQTGPNLTNAVLAETNLQQQCSNIEYKAFPEEARCDSPCNLQFPADSPHLVTQHSARFFPNSPTLSVFVYVSCPVSLSVAIFPPLQPARSSSPFAGLPVQFPSASPVQSCQSSPVPSCQFSPAQPIPAQSGDSPHGIQSDVASAATACPAQFCASCSPLPDLHQLPAPFQSPCLRNSHIEEEEASGTAPDIPEGRPGEGVKQRVGPGDRTELRWGRTQEQGKTGLGTGQERNGTGDWDETRQGRDETGQGRDRTGTRQDRDETSQDWDETSQDWDEPGQGRDEPGLGRDEPGQGRDEPGLGRARTGDWDEPRQDSGLHRTEGELRTGQDRNKTRDEVRTRDRTGRGPGAGTEAGRGPGAGTKAKGESGATEQDWTRQDRSGLKTDTTRNRTQT